MPSSLECTDLLILAPSHLARPFALTDATLTIQADTVPVGGTLKIRFLECGDAPNPDGTHLTSVVTQAFEVRAFTHAGMLKPYQFRLAVAPNWGTTPKAKMGAYLVSTIIDPVGWTPLPDGLVYDNDRLVGVNVPANLFGFVVFGAKP